MASAPRAVRDLGEEVDDTVSRGGLIVGTAFKRDGVTTNPVDAARLREFMEVVGRG